MNRGLGRDSKLATGDTVEKHSTCAEWIGRVLRVPIGTKEVIDEIIVLFACDRHRLVCGFAAEAAIHQWESQVFIGGYISDSLQVMSHLVRCTVPNRLSYGANVA